MTNKIKELQEDLEKKGIYVSETAIVDAAIEFLLQWGGNMIFRPEFWENRKR